MACAGFACSRNALAVLNVLYIVISCIIIGVAAYARLAAGVGSVSVMGGLIACGVFLFLVALVGLIGAVRHHQVLLFFYMIILFVIFLLQFLIACLCLALSADQQRNIALTGWSGLTGDGQVDLQNKLQCCGFEANASVILDCHKYTCCADSISSGNPAPCCDAGSNSTSENSQVNTLQDCPCPSFWEMVAGPLNSAIKMAGVFGLIFSFTEIFGVCMTVRYRNQKDPRANPSAFL